jgi:hypothetical protein
MKHCNNVSGNNAMEETENRLSLSLPRQNPSRTFGKKTKYGFLTIDKASASCYGCHGPMHSHSYLLAIGQPVPRSATSSGRGLMN